MEDKRDAKIREQVDRLGRPPRDMLDREIARQERNESYWKLTRGILVGLLVAMATIIIVTNLWVSVLQVDGSSMNPLLRMDEIVFAVRNRNPSRNSIIAFSLNNKVYIKRVIATGDDVVDIAQDGTVSVNDQRLDEPYVSESSLGNCDISFPFRVPSGTVFVLGDDRPTALDSRSSEFGTVGKDQIIGQLVCTIWPLSRVQNLWQP